MFTTIRKGYVNGPPWIGRLSHQRSCRIFPLISALQLELEIKIIKTKDLNQNLENEDDVYLNMIIIQGLAKNNEWVNNQGEDEDDLCVLIFGKSIASEPLSQDYIFTSFSF